MSSPFRRRNLAPGVLTAIGVTVLILYHARPSATSLLAGLPLIVAGEGLRLWAAGHLEKTHRLAVSGPYRYLRHPLYAGTLLISLGVLTMAGPPVTWICVPAAIAYFFLRYLPQKDGSEARRLEARHGARFRRYAAAVHRIWPRLRPWSEPSGSPRSRWRFDRLVANDELGAALGVALLAAAVALRAL